MALAAHPIAFLHRSLPDIGLHRQYTTSVKSLQPLRTA
jgi:hypothetical protein